MSDETASDRARAARGDARPDDPRWSALAIPASEGGPPVISADALASASAPFPVRPAAVIRDAASDTARQGPEPTRSGPVSPAPGPAPAAPAPWALGCTALIVIVVLIGLVAALTSTAWTQMSPSGIGLAAIGIGAAGAFAAGGAVAVVRGVLARRRR
ncbi:hypothetical protein GCM10027515_25970 [Schumannella luteola]|uniref:Uncharacterized protein n=1 Tax=Schumannella luteola TaxID=472059 RepID=A0A852YQU3_9MICO|nr:hypothetical protein [Schumannella luteola]NYG99605.1 hypothetical protein [Schumannella luteola]TPX02006.1 hypothetical protein FJ656_24570 [Schumannella luteola]